MMDFYGKEAYIIRAGGESMPDDRRDTIKYPGGKSEHHRAGCSITWSRSDAKASATESRPPSAAGRR